MIRDLTDEEARRALVLKWGSVDPDVLPAWVAEMDYALAPPVADALQRAVADGVTGYPAVVDGGALGEAYAGFARRHFGQQVDPEQVLPTVDVTAGVRVALDVLSEPGPMVLPTPGLPPAVRARAGARTARSGTCRWTRTPRTRRSTSTGSTACSPAARRRCCSPSRTTRSATSTPGPSSRGSATWSCATARG